MRPASMHLSLYCAISGTTGWAFSWTSPLSLGLAGCIVCWWGCTRCITRYIIRLKVTTLYGVVVYQHHP